MFDSISKSRRQVVRAALVPSAAVIGTLCLCLTLLLSAIAISGEPVIFSYRTISAVEAADQPGTTIFTLEVQVTNMDRVAYSYVSIGALSSADPSSDYGSLVMGDLPVGGSRTAIGQFRVPNQAISTMTLKVSAY